MTAYELMNDESQRVRSTAGLFDHLDRFAERTALITDDGNWISYRDMLADADALGTHVQPGELVLLIAANHPAAITAYVGLQRAGAVIMLVNQKTDDDAILRLVERFQPEYLCLPAAQAVRHTGSRSVVDFGDYCLLASAAPQCTRLDPALAVLLGTSGSTGSPDYVRLSRRNLLANTRSIISYLGVSATDRAMTTMPMSYSYGLSIINTHLYKGASLVLSESALVEKPFWTLLHDAEATTFGGVPFIYQLLHRLRFHRMNLPSLRYLTQAGGRLDPTLVGYFAQHCAQARIGFFVMYGQTEATARIAYLPPHFADSKPGSIGIAIPGGELWLEDANGQRITTPDAVGELIYRGDNVSLGYANDRDGLTADDQFRGVLCTGDMARIDADGMFYLVGRKSRFVKIYGLRVALDEVEQLLANSGIEAVCGGTDDRLLVFTTQVDKLTTIRALLSARTSISPQGIDIRAIDEIPRNDSGKVRYAALPTT